MKHIYQPFRALCVNAAILVSVLLTALAPARAQTMITFSILHAPCNDDGVLQAEGLPAMIPPVTFTWYIGNQSITHTSATLFDTLSNYSGASLYAVAADASGITSYGFFTGQPPFMFTTSTTPAVCPALGTASVNITSGGTPPYAVQWLEAGTNNVVSTSNPASLPAGPYDAYITDAGGCAYLVSSADSNGTSPNGIYVQNNSPVVATASSTPTSCTNGTATAIAVGGIAPYTYEWNNGANSASINGLSMGQYIVTVTDAQGCYGVAYTYIQQNVYINANPSVTDASCLESNGSVIVFGSNGTPPYTYHWENGSTNQTRTGLSAGYYNLTVTDANNCIGTAYVNVGSTTPITATYTATPSSCTASTGSATVSLSGGMPPYTIVWNTYPGQTGLTASGLPSGSYYFHATDNNGCVRSGEAYIPPISVINAHLNTSDAMCTQANGLAAVAITSGTPPYTYNWSNGATNASISGLAAGSYAVTITDAQSCSIVKYAGIGVSTPINIGVSSTQASCVFANDGSLSATPIGGTAPYAYNWSNGSTVASATGLSTGDYWVNVTDAAGCVQNQWSHVGYNPSNNACYCTLTGTVYDDQNGNCVHDAGEPGIQNIMIHCTGQGYAFTDANGIYSFIVPSGSYTLSEAVQYFYPLASCQSNGVAVNVTASSGCVNTVDFANVINPVHDVSVVTVNDFNPPIPGNNYVQKVIVTNDGSVTENDVQLGYRNDGQLNFASSAPVAFTQPNAGLDPNWYAVSSGFPALAPSQSQVFDVTYNVPTNIPLGTSVAFYDTVAYAAPISNWLMDYTPWNNVNTRYTTVVGSFDPNYKEVSPQGTGAPGYIKSRDSVLTYTVHFQNTGSWAAQKVVVKDTLDANLNVATLQPGYASYPYVAKLSDNGVLTFTFDNIMLPDSSSQPEGSQGMVTYSIHLKPNLPEFTQIHNTASIFFDYNAPVITNTTVNTIDNGLGVHEINRVFDFTLFPNPTNASLTIAVNTDVADNATLAIHNLLGQKVQTQNVTMKKGKNLLSADVSELPSGVYFVELKQGQQSLVQKLNVIK